MRVAKVHLSLRKRAIREACDLASAPRQFEGYAMSGTNEKRKLVPAKRRNELWSAAGADHDERPDD